MNRTTDASDDDGLISSIRTFFPLSLSLKTIQRELYRSAARIVDSSSVAPRAPERKVRTREEVFVVDL